MEVIWTQTSIETYYNVIDYLLSSWTKAVLQTFELNVDNLLIRIINNYNICPESKIFGLRKCVIDENNSLIYEILGHKIYLLTFVDNRSDHEF